jgi:hypothetical protein
MLLGPFHKRLNYINQLNSFSEPNHNTHNPRQVSDFCPIPPSPAGCRRQRVWDQGQPLRVLIQFASAANMPVLGLKEMDGPLKFMGPVFFGEISRFLVSIWTMEPAGIMGARVRSSIVVCCLLMSNRSICQALKGSAWSICFRSIIAASKLDGAPAR